jgi:Ni/Co efflux regulator RcnB
MEKKTMQKNCILAFVIALTLAIISPALADKPSWAGNKNKGGKHEKKNMKNSNMDNDYGYWQDRNRSGINVSVHFDDQQRNVIHNYYAAQYPSAHCPPGLAKKNKRCMPPGQAKKWQVGQQLPREVIFHDLPSGINVQLGSPPSGYRFVRVASDILLIAVGTGMVLDAIQDLNKI